MKRFVLTFALLSAAVFAFDVSAEPPVKEGGKRGKAGQGDASSPRGLGRAGKGAAGKGAAGVQYDPAKFIAVMIERHDTDGDQKLDVTELTALFTSMRERRGGLAGARGRQGAGRFGGVGRKRGGGDGQTERGGAKPKRPDAE